MTPLNWSNRGEGGLPYSEVDRELDKIDHGVSFDPETDIATAIIHAQRNISTTGGCDMAAYQQY